MAEADALKAARGLRRRPKRPDGGRKLYSVTGLKVTDIPLLAEQWDEVRNVGLDPSTIIAGSRKRVSLAVPDAPESPLDGPDPPARSEADAMPVRIREHGR